LIAWASQQPSWAIGFGDEVWWSRFALPAVHAWQSQGHPVRVVEQPWKKDDPDPKALACYGVLWQQGTPDEPDRSQAWLRFVTGRPVSSITTQFVEWCCQRLLKQGKTNWLLIWDNASWHKSQAVRTWIREHNQQVKQTGQGVRILPFLLPTQSPWLNPIVRHEVVSQIVQHGTTAMREPAVPSAVPYGDNKPPDNVPTVARLALKPRGGRVSASFKQRGPRVGSMVSVCKLSINVVMSNKLKKLRSLSQNGTVVGKGVDRSPFMGRKHYRRTEST
jgi:hypothetical protein